jgi:hypothetical protein
MTGRESDEEQRVALADLLARGGLDPGAPAYSVAQKVIFSGYASLTRAQKGLYEAVIAPALAQEPQRAKRPRHRAERKGREK